MIEVRYREHFASQGGAMSMALPPVILPKPDYARLERLAKRAWSDQHPTAQFLLSEIRRVLVVDDSVVVRTLSP